MEPGHAYGYRFLFMFLIVGVNAFFAAAETALVSVRPSRLKQMKDEGAVGAQAAISLLENPERLLSVSQVGLTLASLGLGWLGEATLEHLFSGLLAPLSTPVTEAVLGVLSLVLAFAVMTFIHVVAGEVVPKNLAMEKADRLAVLVAPVLLVFYKLVGPFVWVIERAAGAASRLIGVHGHHHGAHTSEELKFIVATSRSEGHLTRFEDEAMRRILELEDFAVREVMVPRSRMVTVRAGADIDEVLRLMSESRYSRVPVCEDGSENPVGYVHVKDVLEFWTRRRQSNLRRRAVAPFTLLSILRKAPIVLETLSVHLALEQMRERQAHVAFVVDEFGTVNGLISIEDVFEQVFGEIEDEFDVEVEEVPEEEADSYEVDGATLIRDLQTQYGVEVESSEEFETVAGLVLYRLGRIPEAGEMVEEAGRRFTVVEMDHVRIAKVRVERLRDGERV